MAKRDAEPASAFDISVGWPSGPVADGAPLQGSSFGRLEIRSAAKVLTKYRTDSGEAGESVELPLYPFAEWVATNWWALLYEPLKSDVDGDASYRWRHWLGAARAGHSLPDLTFQPVGDRVEVDAQPSYLRSARLTFSEGENVVLDRLAVSEPLRRFVEQVLARLTTAGVTGTVAHEAWDLVCNTATDSEQYCRLIGSLGLCPYDENDQVDVILDRLSSSMSGQLLLDLCQASDIASLARAAVTAESMSEALPSAQLVDVSPLQKVKFPADASSLAWRRGVEAAEQARHYLGLSSSDPTSGAAFLNELGIDFHQHVKVSSSEQDLGRLSGAISPENESTIRMALVEDGEAQRRFTAARAAFFGWMDNRHGSRLITSARTREQQASRAFAAEMLAPIRAIKARSGGGNRAISSYRVNEIAVEFNVSPAVVHNQARNNRMSVLE